jgi:hypothetical protein
VKRLPTADGTMPGMGQGNALLYGTSSSRRTPPSPPRSSTPAPEIQLDNLAKIVKCDTQPRSLADYELDPRISENKLDIKIPYLNPKGNRSEVSLEIISIGNGTEDCTVNLFGKGIEERQRRLNVRPRTFGLMYFMLGTLLSSLVVGGVIFVDRTLTTGLLSNPQLPSFGIGGLIVLTLLTMLVWVIQD